MKQFKTESKRLLNLAIHSIYTNHEIFLRELISNSSDALDKLAIEAIPEGSVCREDLCIRIAFDVDSRILRISDNGIGMDAEALDHDLGTIAYSGSFQFKDQALSQSDAAQAQKEAGNAADLIGQFGIGFYSAFMVADKVKVISRAFGSEEANSWQSDGVSGYTIEPAVRDEHGTDVILHIRKSTLEENLERYLDAISIEGIVKRYSNYIRYPIILEQPDTDEAGKQGKEAPEPHILNSMVPLWTRKQDEVKPEEYNEFYRSEFRDKNDCLRAISFHGKQLNYDALLFIPAKNSKNPFGTDLEPGLRLYSSNVMVSSCCKELLPGYFGFVRGLVDSRDIPLNVSRETMQEITGIETIEKDVESQIAQALQDMCANDRETYIRFFNEFGFFLKHAISASYGSLTEILHDFLLFYSAKQKRLITLAEYIEADSGVIRGSSAMGSNIYYATGDNKERLAHTPSVEAVLASGHDVLLCDGSVGDEMCFMVMGSYKGANFCNVATVGGNVADDKVRDSARLANEENSELFDALCKSTPPELVRVVASTRLTRPEQAACCVVTEGTVTIAMARFLATHKDAPSAAKVSYTLELNVSHPVFARLKAAYDAGDDARVADFATLLLGEALLVEDVRLENPFTFCSAINQLLV